MVKQWPKKKKFIFIILIVITLFVVFVTALFIKESFQCGEFNLALMDMSSKQRTCMTPPTDSYTKHAEIEYLNKSYAFEFSHGGNLSSGDYTIQLTTEIGQMHNEDDPLTVLPQNVNLFIEIRPVITKPPRGDELTYIDSGLRACEQPVLMKPGLKIGQYLYQIRTAKYIYTITYDNRQNSYEEKGRGQEMLQTLLDTMKCREGF